MRVAAVLAVCVTSVPVYAQSDAAGAVPVEVPPIHVHAPRDAPHDSDDSDDSQGIGRLVSHAPRAAEQASGLSDSAFVTTIPVDEHVGETTSLAEVLADSVGVHVRSLGGLGGFSTISVRGGASGHTAVSIDGVPLSRVASSTADLGALSLDSFSEVRLYRGAVPTELGAAALGGALDLITPVGLPNSGKPIIVSLGGGSFSTRHAHVRWLADSPDGTAGYHVSGSYQGTSGAFEYFDDNGTNLILTDDEMVTRQNNGHDQAELVGRVDKRHRDWHLSSGIRSLFRRQGLPGRGSVQSQAASASTLGQIVDARLEKQRLWGSPRLVGTGLVFGSFEWQHYRDGDGEVRLGVQDSRQWWLSTGGSARVSIDAGDTHLLSVGTSGRFELAGYTDALSDGDARGRGLRVGTAVSLSDEMALGHHARWVLAPAMRLDVLHTLPMGDANQPVVGDGELHPRTDVFFSPRVSARARIVDSIALKGSAGLYMREPTIPELFGGRGVHVGNPALEVEHGLSSDIGFVVAPAPALGSVDRLYLEGAWFFRQPENTIVYRSTLGGSFNLGDSSMYGIEVRGSARLARTVTGRVHYSFIRTRQHSTLPSYDGKPLPHAPEHQLYARIDVARRVGEHLTVLWSDLSMSSGNYLDLAGRSPVPTRRFIGAGVKLQASRDLIIGLEGKNLMDVRVESVTYDPPPSPDLTRVPRALADFYGYPLPGRAIYLTLDWQP